VIRVVLDANVLVSEALARDPAAPSVRAFDALLDERIEVIGCPALLGEVAAVLGRDGFGATYRSRNRVGSWPTSRAS
jgi:predicted nucleic acid-binding protein